MAGEVCPAALLKRDSFAGISSSGLFKMHRVQQCSLKGNHCQLVLVLYRQECGKPLMGKINYETQQLEQGLDVTLDLESEIPLLYLC